MIGRQMQTTTNQAMRRFIRVAMTALAVSAGSFGLVACDGSPSKDIVQAASVFHGIVRETMFSDEWREATEAERFDQFQKQLPPHAGDELRSLGVTGIWVDVSFVPPDETPVNEVAMAIATVDGRDGASVAIVHYDYSCRPVYATEDVINAVLDGTAWKRTDFDRR